MRNDSFINECISSISELDTVTMESQMDVLCSTIDAYDKMSTICEEATNGTDQFMTYSESYEYFEESEKTFGDKFKEHFDEGNIIKSIFMFPINLIKMLINQIKKLFNHKEMTRAEKVGEFFKSNGGKVKEFGAKILNFISDPENKGPVTICGVVIGAGTLFAFREKIIEIGNKFLTGFKNLVKKIKSFFAHKFNEDELSEVLKPETCIGFAKIEENGKTRYEFKTTVNLEEVVSFLELFNNVTQAYGRVVNNNKISDISVKKVRKYTVDLNEARKKELVSKEPKYYYTEQQILDIIDKIKDCQNFFSSGAAGNVITALNTAMNSFNNYNEYSVFDFDSDYYYQEADEAKTPDPGNKNDNNSNDDKSDENKQNETENKTRTVKTKSDVTLKHKIKQKLSADYKAFKAFLTLYQSSSVCVSALYDFISNIFFPCYNNHLDALKEELSKNGETLSKNGETPAEQNLDDNSDDASPTPMSTEDKDDEEPPVTTESYYFTDDNDEEYDSSTVSWYSR